jgi:hypothetical protein
VTSPASKPKSPYKGTGYWVSQLLISGFFLLAGTAGGLFILFAPDCWLNTRTCAPDGRGEGVMLLLVGIVFGIMFFAMLRAWRRMSKEQRAVYAWAIMQQHATRTDGHPVNPRAAVNDLAIMGVAARAKRGDLSIAEIRRLQELRPDVPYPGSLPLPQTRRED